MNIIEDIIKPIAEQVAKDCANCIAANSIVEAYCILDWDNYMEGINYIKKEFLKNGIELFWNENDHEFHIIDSVPSVISVAKK